MHLVRMVDRTACPCAGSVPSQLEPMEARSAGDVWALWHLWQSLGFEDLSLGWSYFSCRLVRFGPGGRLSPFD
jgi:hypothetical protein